MCTRRARLNRDVAKADVILTNFTQPAKCKEARVNLVKIWLRLQYKGKISDFVTYLHPSLLESSSSVGKIQSR